MGKKESYECNRRSPDRAQPLGIDVRLARGCCDTLIVQERLHVAQLGLWLQSQFSSQCRLLLPIAPPDGRQAYRLFSLRRSRHGRRYRFLLATDFLCNLLSFFLLSIFWIRITHNRYYPVIG